MHRSLALPTTAVLLVIGACGGKDETEDPGPSAVTIDAAASDTCAEFAPRRAEVVGRLRALNDEAKAGRPDFEATASATADLAEIMEAEFEHLAAAPVEKDDRETLERLVAKGDEIAALQRAFSNAFRGEFDQIRRLDAALQQRVSELQEIASDADIACLP